MAESRPVFVPFLYPAAFRGRRGVVHEVWAVGKVPVMIPEVSTWPEPASYILEMPGGGLEWRMHDGHLMRPVLMPDGRPSLSGEALFGAIDTRDLNRGPTQSRPWIEHPGSPHLSLGEFRTPYRDEGRDGVIEAPPGLTWLREDRLPAEHRTILRASALVIHDGVAWTRAEPPMLAVYADHDAGEVVVETHVGGTLPDTGEAVAFLAVYEDGRAMALAERLSGTTGFPVADRRSDCIVTGAFSPQPDTGRRFLEHLVAAFHDRFIHQRVETADVGELAVFASARGALAAADAGDASNLWVARRMIRGMADTAPEGSPVHRAGLLADLLGEVRKDLAESLDDTAISMAMR